MKETNDEIMREQIEQSEEQIEEMVQQEEQVLEEEEQLSLNDDRRVRTLSPGRLVAQRFFRNRVADTGLIILLFMFVFSFIGGAITPYKQDQLFYRYDEAKEQYAAVTENSEFRYTVADKASFPSIAQAKFLLAATKGEDSFEAKGVTYTVEEEGDNFYSIHEGSKMVALAAYDVVSAMDADTKIDFDLQYEILKAYTNDEDTFEYKNKEYKLAKDGTVTLKGKEVGYVSRYIVNLLAKDGFLTRQFKDELLECIEDEQEEFTFENEDGEEAVYTISYEAGTKSWSVMETVETLVFDTYSAPSKAHWLGTDRNGMDMLTRLMYGGRVSLYIGFIVVFIESIIGIILGGVSGYFGGWVDNLIMRIVDIFYCIPSLPIIIILGATMDAMRVDPQIRMVYLMLILGFLGWPGIARMVRGQILSLREQEFMTATEACGIRASRRIFRHLIPNVIPQLIVIMTMSLGDTILTEATLSFLGLGVKFPFASWGNIINDVNNTYVLTNYWFIWIPAGVCLLLTVLAFNLVGDGLRDAFDPKMKR